MTNKRKRAKPVEHMRRLPSGKRIKVNKGVKRKVRRSRTAIWSKKIKLALLDDSNSKLPSGSRVDTIIDFDKRKNSPEFVTSQISMPRVSGGEKIVTNDESGFTIFKPSRRFLVKRKVKRRRTYVFDKKQKVALLDDFTPNFPHGAEVDTTIHLSKRKNSPKFVEPSFNLPRTSGGEKVIIPQRSSFIILEPIKKRIKSKYPSMFAFENTDYLSNKKNKENKEKQRKIIKDILKE